jgi:ATP-dependent DNA ligase
MTSVALERTARPQDPHAARRREREALEGVVAKRLSSVYRPGERGWIKIKNPDYWRYLLEVTAVQQRAVSRG